MYALVVAPEFLEWISSIGQGVGALATAGAAYVAVRLARQAHHRADVSQASTVTSSVEWTDTTDKDNLFVQYGLRSDAVRVDNHGSTPIFTPRIEAIISRSTPGMTLRRTSEVFEEMAAELPAVVPSGGKILLPFELRDAERNIVTPADVEVTLSFRDALGVKWQRKGTEAPVHAPPEPKRSPRESIELAARRAQQTGDGPSAETKTD
ncbi:hypothetical protein [Qaidamihabitans albus]|uniref:hypothetical protein n=1 Tax=Qaidamihabitans albus TaxID=2795733 RepID=UPI0018F246E4|nr:hypothetical protein [Qaidamihabitans albus]